MIDKQKEILINMGVSEELWQYYYFSSNNDLFTPVFEKSDLVKTGEEIFNDLYNIDLIKQVKIQELSNACNNSITKQFYSDADGTKKLYDFELENQVNISTKAYHLQIAKLSGQPITTVSYYAKDETCHDYTAEQFLKLALDGETWKTTNIVKYKDKLKPLVEACKTADGVNAIAWESDVNATQATI